MQVAYLDEAGTDRLSPIVTIAGYVAEESQWKAFENEVEPIFQRYQVPVLHAVDLYGTAGFFAGWSRLKKQAFVSEICHVLGKHAPLGTSASVLKSGYHSAKSKAKRKRTVTPVTFCANMTWNWLITDRRVGEAVNEQGVRLIFESGNNNAAETRQSFYDVQRLHKIEHILKAISFVPKESCRAIQMADLLAYFTKRHGIEAVENGNPPRDPNAPIRIIDIIARCVPLHTFVATDFETDLRTRRK